MTSTQPNAPCLRAPILIVEDEEDLRDLLRSALEMSGYSVAAAEDGQDALRKVDEIGAPCLVLLDLLMPGMNGWQFLEEFRRRPEHRSVPVIVHSSAASRPIAGATQVVQKPVPLERLLSLVGEYC